MKSAEDQRRLEELFFLATELEPDERAGFLERHCSGDPALRAELEALLRRDREDTADLLRPGTLFADAPETPDGALPERVGRYRLVEPIGEGGMGVVWLAEQEWPVQRRVALKFVKSGRAEAGVLERFQRERQALASMDHPGIARIYDGGSMEGRPWFAMERAEGEPIDAFVRRESLVVTSLLQLFVRVCSAVQHAHQKGIVHRDLKPANVLVAERDGEAIPKLVDFGLARVLEEPAAAGSDRGGTRSYVSPEQASGGGADTRSDIYSLGVLLFELLTGRLPHLSDALTGLNGAELATHLRTRRAPWPSQVAVDARRSASLRGDLDRIVARALDPHPEARYPSVGELAADLQRWLAHEPVSVSPSGWLYRGRLAIQRNKLVSALGAAAVLILIVGLFGTLQGFRRAADQEALAAREAEESRRITRFLVETLATADPSVALDSELSVRALLDGAAARVAETFGDSPLGEARVRRTLGSAYRFLGDLDSAEEHILRAVELLQASPEVERAELYQTLWALVLVYDELHSRKGLEYGLRALALRQAWFAEEVPELGAAVEEMALSFLAGEWEASLAALAEVEALAGERFAPGDPRWLVLADDLSDFGFVISRRMDDPGAEHFLQAGLAILTRELPANHPEIARVQGWLITVWLREGAFQRAYDLLTESLRIYEEVLPRQHWLASEARSRLGECLLQLGEAPAAEPLLTSGREELLRTRGPESAATLDASRRLLSYYERTGRAEAERALREELVQTLAFSPCTSFDWERQEAAFGAAHAGLLQSVRDLRGEVLSLGLFEPDPSSDLAAFRSALGEVLRQRRESVPAGNPLSVLVARLLVDWCFNLPLGVDVDQEALYREMLGVLEPYRERLPDVYADCLLGLARQRSSGESPQDAARMTGEALALYELELGSASPSALHAKIDLGSLHAQGRRFADGEPILLTAWHTASELFGDQNELTLRSQSALGALYEAWGKPTEADRWRSFAR